MNFNLFQSSNNNQLGQRTLDFMSDDDGELDFSAVMQQELESHDLLLMQSEAAAHHHPLSPPTVIIPSSSSNNINNNCTAADDGDLYKSNVLASVGDHHQNMMFPLNFVGGHTTPHVNTTTSNDQQQHSPRTPRLNLDAASVLQSWLLILDNTITNNNNNNNINNNNHNSSTTTPIHNNNNNNLNNNNNNNNNINLNNINHHTTYNNTTSDQNLQDTLENLIQNNKHRQQIHDMLTNNNNNSNNNTTTSMQSQSYLGSVLANCTSIHSPNMRSTMNQRSNHSHQHSKSPSFGSGNYNSKLNSGVRKASSQRSNSTSCFQSIQSYTASKMHLAAASATSMMNMNGGLNSPSVASTCSSNLTMSPANVSTNSFNQLINNNNNGHMGYMSNSNSNNNSSATVGSSSNQQYSPIVTNQQQMVAGATVSGSNKKGKLPANRPVVDKNSNNQFTFVNSQHSKGLLVEANPNDRPIKMQQCKIVDGGIKIQIEDGISKNKKDTGLQFHTCTFK